MLQRVQDAPHLLSGKSPPDEHGFFLLYERIDSYQPLQRRAIDIPRDLDAAQFFHLKQGLQPSQCREHRPRVPMH